MVYQSKHQPRHQQFVSFKIFKPSNYYAFYDITFEALEQKKFPIMTVPEGQLMLRKVNAVLTSEQARTIPPGSSMNGNNRFSGPRLDGRSGQGGLYMGTVAGILREHAHYSLQSKHGAILGTEARTLFTPGNPDKTRAFIQAQKTGAMPTSPERFHLFRLKQTLRFADLRVTSLLPLFRRLRESEELCRNFQVVNHLPLMLRMPSDLQDYSAARGIADAVYDRRHINWLAGVCAESSRADTDSGLVYDSHGDSTGGLVFAIFEKDGVPINVLEPVAVYDTFEAIAAAVVKE